MELGGKLQLADKALIGMVHVAALPGTPCCSMSVNEIVERAAEEARTLEGAGFDAVIIENMHDRPYLLREVGPEIVSCMTSVGVAIRRAVDIPFGIQILAGANHAALAVAAASGAAFIRAEGFVFAHVADEGLMAKADAAELLRYRKQIGAEHIAIIADIKKKHSSHAITTDIDLTETAQAAHFFGADGVIVTGTSTGKPAQPQDVVRAAKAGLPVIVGSGLTPDNLADFWKVADGFIVGSALKEDGIWSNPMDASRVRQFIESAHVSLNRP